MEERKLYKINQGKIIDGVCGGIAEYFGVDATIVRVAWIVLALAAGSGVLAYVLAARIMPRKPELTV